MFDANRRVLDAFWQASALRRHDTAVRDAIQRLVRSTPSADTSFFGWAMADHPGASLAVLALSMAGSAPPALGRPGPTRLCRV